MDDLDFGDDVALLVHNYNPMQEKTTQKEESIEKLGLSVISKGKTKSMTMKTTNNSSVFLEKGAIDNVSYIIYVPGKYC